MIYAKLSFISVRRDRDAPPRDYKFRVRSDARTASRARAAKNF